MVLRDISIRITDHEKGRNRTCSLGREMACPQIAGDVVGGRSCIGDGQWSIGLPGSGALVPLPRLLPRRWRAGEPRTMPTTTTFSVAPDTYAEALARVAARAGDRARLAAAAAADTAAAV